MNASQLTELRKLRWGAILALSIGALFSGFLLILMLPAYRDLVYFGLYSIPSQMLVSPFPHEPALLQAAKFYSAGLIALAGTIGCCIGGFLDYWIIAPLMHHRHIRPKLDNTRMFRNSLKYFFRYPFSILVVAAISPVPFYPFKFLSVAGNYPIWKYQAALIAGRTPRYFVLAVLGHALQVPTWLLVVLFILIVISPFTKKLYDMARGKRPQKDAQVIEKQRPDKKTEQHPGVSHFHNGVTTPGNEIHRN